MAELSFKLYDVNGSCAEVDSPVSFELSRDVSAPCDGLRLSFLTEELLNEIVRVEAYLNENKIFNGLCDVQRETVLASGFSVFLYARSTACVLIDNDAVSYTYESPSARGLYIINAEPLGFTFAFDDCFCEGSYTVGRGVSCYSAVNNLVRMIKKRNIVVTPDNELTVPDGKRVIKLDCEKLLSEKRIINRASPLSRIDYKASSNSDYSYHFKSRSLDRAGVNRTKRLNLSSLPDWEKSYALNNIMTRSAFDYKSIELVSNELAFAELYSLVELDGGSFNLESYRVKSVDYVLNDNGERMILKLFKEIDLEEIIYVD